MELLVKYGASIQAITEVRVLILHAVSDNNIWFGMQLFRVYFKPNNETLC